MLILGLILPILKNMKLLLLATSLFVATLLSSCGGGGTPQNPAQALASFTATLTGSVTGTEASDA
jgi:hypothetical protein